MKIYRRDRPISSTAWWLWLVVGITAVLAAMVAVYGQTTTSRDELCFSIEGPPDEVSSIENPQYDTQFGLLPFGVGCTWELPDGSYLFVGNSNILPSALFYGGLVLGFVSFARLSLVRGVR